MTRLLSSILLGLLFFLSTVDLTAQKQTNNLEDLVLFFPREEGSTQERQTILWLQNLARSLKLTSSITSVNPSNGQAFSYSQNIEIVIPGQTEDEILYLTPLNNSNASLFPIILLLQDLATQQDKPKIGARFVFLGAETGDTSAYPMGSKAFLKTYTPVKKAVYFYFDFAHPTDTPSLWTTDETPPTLWPLQQAKMLLNDFGIKPQIPAFSAIISRLPFISEKIVSLYFNENLSGVHLTSPKKDKLSTERLLLPWAENMKEAFLLWHLNLIDINQTVEKNYVTIGPLIIPESVYICILIIFCAVMTSILYMTKKFIFSLYRQFWRHKRDFSLVFIITFLCFFLSGLFSLSLLVLKGNLNFWQENPLLFMLYKTLVFLPLYFVFLQFLRDVNLSTIQKSSIRMALLFSINNAIILIFINVTFIWPILWSIGCFLIALTFPSRIWIRNTALILAPVFITLMIYPIFTSLDHTISEFFLFDNLFANFILTIIFFPTTLTILTAQFKNPYLVLKRNRILGILSGLFLIGITYGIFNHKFYPKDQQPLNIRIFENMNLNYRFISLSSPYKLGTFDLMLNGVSYHIDKARKDIQLESSMHNKLDINYTITKLFNTKSIEFQIQSSRLIEIYDIILSSTTDLLITNSNYPIQTIRKDIGPINFFVLTGKNPPNPLIIRLVVGQENNNMTIKATGKIKDHLEIAETKPERFDIRTELYMTVEREIKEEI